MAWAAAAKALEYLNDERSVTDVLAVAHRAVDRGDEERALLALSAAARLLPPDGVPLVRLGDRARSRGLLDVVHAVARELQRSDVPVPTQPDEIWKRDLEGRPGTWGRPSTAEDEGGNDDASRRETRQAATR
jgi:hypothetical protein